MSKTASHLVDRLSLCWGSMEGVKLPDFLASAAHAGFGYVTLSPAQYTEARDSGWSGADLHRALQEHHLQVSNIDPLFNWMPNTPQLDGDDPIAVCSRASAADVFRIAHSVGTDLVNAPLGFAMPESEQQIVDSFGQLCVAAAAEGLRVSLEFMPFNQVPDLATANRIVAAANCNNGGIMFDCWHHQRSGGSVQEILQVPGERFFAVQLDDALPRPMADVLEETLNHRCLPGAGCIDLAAVLGALLSTGAQFLCDVEVFDAGLRDLDASTRAQRLYAASAATLNSLGA